MVPAKSRLRGSERLGNLFRTTWLVKSRSRAHGLPISFSLHCTLRLPLKVSLLVKYASAQATGSMRTSRSVSLVLRSLQSRLCSLLMTATQDAAHLGERWFSGSEKWTLYCSLQTGSRKAWSRDLT